MTSNQIKYDIELLCDYSQWWRYNIYIMVVPYLEDGTKMKFVNLVDRTYDVSTEFTTKMRDMPEGYSGERPLRVVVERCNHIEIFAYIIANTLPESLAIKDSPPFTATLKVDATRSKGERKAVLERKLDVNQWGGTTVIGLRVDANEEGKKKYI